MTLQDLITLYRADMQDEQEPYFCSDKLLTLYANEAQDEACRRGRLLVDSSSPFCKIAYQAGDATVPLDPSVLNVLRAVGDDGQHMAMVEADVMDADYPAWRSLSHRYRRPTRLVSGLDTGALHLWPRPNEAGTIELTVQRLPKARLVNMTDEPEIRAEAHPALAQWLCYRAFSRQDTELFNENKAQAALKKFEAEFGPKVSLRNEQWVREGQGLMPGPLA